MKTLALVVSLVVSQKPNDPRAELDWYEVSRTDHIQAWISPKSMIPIGLKKWEYIAAIHVDNTQDHFLLTVDCMKKIVEPAKAKWAAPEYLHFVCD